MKALFQKSKESLSDNLKQNSMKNLFKTPKGMMRIIKQNAMAVVAIGIAMGSYGLMSFGASSKSDEMITFEYKPPQGVSHPYDEEHVENLSNWEPALSEGCPSPGNDAACTIQVPAESTIGGTELDPIEVELRTSGSGQVFKVEAPNPTGKGYTNPENRNIL